LESLSLAMVLGEMEVSGYPELGRIEEYDVEFWYEIGSKRKTRGHIVRGFVDNTVG
jgi:hypothetical protein